MLPNPDQPGTEPATDRVGARDSCTGVPLETTKPRHDQLGIVLAGTTGLAMDAHGRAEGTEDVQPKALHRGHRNVHCLGPTAGEPRRGPCRTEHTGNVGPLVGELFDECLDPR